MNIEVRADNTARIVGYVNVPGKISNPVITPHGRCVETIEERAFERAIDRAGNLTVTLDHDRGTTYANTQDGTLELREDAIGLHAKVTISDPTLVDLARKGRIKGWSFGMYNGKDEMEIREENPPLRHIKSVDLDQSPPHARVVVCTTATNHHRTPRGGWGD